MLKAQPVTGCQSIPMFSLGRRWALLLICGSYKGNGCLVDSGIALLLTGQYECLLLIYVEPHALIIDSSLQADL